MLELIRNSLENRYRIRASDPKFIDKLRKELGTNLVSILVSFNSNRIDVFDESKSFSGKRKLATIPVIHSGGIGQISTIGNYFECVPEHNGKNLANAIKKALAHAHIEP